MKDLRTLCDEAIQLWEADCDMEGVINEMRTTLAQPGPEGPTDEELLQIAAATIYPYESCGIAIGEYEAETECAVEVYGSELIAYARAAIARWGRPAIKPVPVSERWPEFSDCDHQERVWAWNPVMKYWILNRLNRSIHTHWLPHHALPVLTTRREENLDA